MYPVSLRSLYLEHRRDEESLAPEELIINIPGVEVSGELVPEGPGHGVPLLWVSVEQEVEVGEEVVPGAGLSYLYIVSVKGNYILQLHHMS